MNKFHMYGAVRFSKETGKVEIFTWSPIKSELQLWAFNNTTGTNACMLVDLDERKPVAEYVGMTDGSTEVRENPDEFEFNLPDDFFPFSQTRLKRGLKITPLTK